MPDDFESLDAIEKHFGKLRKAAADDDDQVRALTLEEREAKADFREQSAIRRELASHRKDALKEIPEDFHEFVTGNSPEEIDASAKKVKERLDKLTAANNDDDDRAKNLYGKLPNGGGQPPPPRSSEQEKWLEDFQGRFNDEAGSFTTGEVKKFAEMLGGAHLLHNLAQTSRIFQRNGLTPEVVQQHEEGKLRQTRPSKTGVSVAPRG